MSDLKFLYDAIERRTPGPWWNGSVIYTGSSDLVHTPLFDPDHATEADMVFVSTMGTCADDIKKSLAALIDIIDLYDHDVDLVEAIAEGREALASLAARNPNAPS